MGAPALDTPVQYVKGVGPTRAEQLSQLGVHNVEDLLTYFPFRFDLRKQVQPIASLKGDKEAVTVAGEIVDISENRFTRRPYLEVTLRDETAMLRVKWFHGGYLKDKFREGVYLAVSGRTSVFREQIQLINPRFQILWDPSGAKLDRDELEPVYPAGAKLTSSMIAAVVARVLPLAANLIPRWFDRQYLLERGLCTRGEAVAAMHRPKDKEHWSIARRRIAYDECMVMQLGIALMRMRAISRPAHQLPVTDEIDRRIRARFPFALTEAQDKTVGEIVIDLARRRPMNRLLQGDVGSGKTVVALYAALLAVARGKQVAIMAPTEILASQHYRKIETYLAGSKVRTAMLIGGQKQAKRREVLAGLASGETDIVVGTHAIVGDKVAFAKLALVVVDEQHKFGVRQRTSIRGKGYAPHYLVMTATPIPRTLAMTVFGDLDVSTIDALPPGRGKTVTHLVGPEKLDEVIETLRARLAAGQQAYLVYPLVSASAQLQLTAAQDAYKDLASGPLKGFELALVHGQMPQAERDSAMDRFRRGEVQALVASVVVEVGLDVPDANVMVVMHAERFGLAQLHQLRGRIGRSSQDAECFLVASPSNPLARGRLEVLEASSDGFRIAEEDLRLRGPGELFGTRQHGLPELKVASLIDDLELLRLARRDAFAIVMEDPDLSAPHHQQLRRQVLKAYGGKLELIAGA